MKTKHWLFWTGGSDSALILHYLIELMKRDKTKKDEVVCVMIANSSLASGQQNEIEKAFKAYVGSLVEHDVNVNKQLLKRFSVCVVEQSVQHSGTTTVQGMDNKEREFEFELGFAKPDENFSKYGKLFAAQEVVLISAIPSLIPLLGACRNKFMIGSNGSDVANRNNDKLRQLFNLQLEIALSCSIPSDLEKTMKEAGLKPYGRNGDLEFPKEFIPTLSFPLENIRKADVVLMLDSLKLTSYEMQKSNDLLEHYAMVNGSTLYVMTAVYHHFKLFYNHPDDFPSLHDFVKSEALQFTKNGKPYKVEDGLIQIEMQKQMMNLLGRGLGGFRGLGDLLAQLGA